MWLHTVRKLFQRPLSKYDIISCLATSSGMVLLRIRLEPLNDLITRLVGEEEANATSHQLWEERGGEGRGVEGRRMTRR